MRRTASILTIPVLLTMILTGALAARGVGQGIAEVFVRGGPARRHPHNLQPIRIKKHHVRALVDGSVAKTTITQVFHNPNGMILEGTYVFPVPDDASLTDFTMVMNGKVVHGEVLERDKARRVYEGIVRSMRDPALLEYVGSRMFRARVFPIQPRGDVEVTLTYVEELEAEGGVVEYRYPLKTQAFSREPVDDLSVHVSLSSQIPIKTVFSSSHKVEKVRKDDRHWEISFEGKQELAQRDFHLFYSFSTHAFGLSLLTDGSTREDGYFMMTLAPSRDDIDGKIIPKDVVFVLDTSGSMREDDKIAQARQALKYGLRGLGEQDRFNVVAFSTEARTYANRLVEVSKASIAEAAAWVDELQASGGTNINDALSHAVQTLGSGDRLGIIVFMTDGLPTVGETRVDAIIEGITKRNERRSRIFCFGVGYDVNARLLDALAEKNRGTRDYVTPSQSIEIVMSSFFDKISHPVLSDLKIEIAGLETYDVYPKDLPDLFKGSELTVFGRYKGSGSHAIKLKGRVGDEMKEFVYEGSFADKKTDRDFIAILWAKRKVGYLMDQIRFNGFNEELKGEVVRLGKKYGIATPYTSMLVTEDEHRPRAERLDRSGRRHRRSWDRPGAPSDASSRGGDATSPAPDGRARRIGDLFGGRIAGGEAAPAAPGASGFAAGASPVPQTAAPETKGKSGVEASLYLKRLREVEVDAVEEEEAQNADGLFDDVRSGGKKRVRKIVKRVLEKTFQLRAGFWVDVELDALKPEVREKRIERVEAFSERYFELIRKYPVLAKYLAKLPRLVIAIKDEAFWFTPPQETKGPAKEPEAPGSDRSGKKE